MRLLPHHLEAARRDPDEPLNSCETCMQSPTITREQRQQLRCGREPIAPERLGKTRPRTLDSFTPETEDDVPTTCPTYTAHLPEVIEGTRARLWTSDLQSFCGEHPPTAALVRAAELAELADGEVTKWKLTPEEDGGGLVRRS